MEVVRLGGVIKEIVKTLSTINNLPYICGMNDVLNGYYEKGLVYKQRHPTLPLTIWNYSEKVQYEGLFNEITLQTRGLVTEENGNIVARPFKKFFNMEENKHTPTEEFDVYEKMDGSLGILFNYQGEWVMATRGSFTSEQAVKGLEILQNYDYQKLHKGYTYLFEIIYKENRIVVQYDYDDLILLGMIETKTGYEVDLYGEGNDVRLKNLISNLGFKVVKKYDGINDYSILKGMIKDNEEGFVVRFSNGDRVKIKGEEYLKLHKLMTNVSTTAIWEMLSEGRDVLELLKDVPDEFNNKIKVYVRDLKYTYFSLSEYAGKTHDGFRYGKFGDKDPEPTKKEFAEFLSINNYNPVIKALCFAMWDKKDYDKIIWKHIKPEFKKL
jgi:T4 RnlA family RNA ligase